MQPKSERATTWPLGVLIVALVGLLAFYAYRHRFDHDEFESIHVAWKLLHGERFAVDFFEHHHPLSYYLLVPVIALFGETITTIFAARAVVFVHLLGIAGLTYLLAAELFDRRTGLVAVVLLLSAMFFYQKAIEVRPDVPMTLCGMLALLALFKGLERSDRRWLIISALSLAVSFLILQKAVFLVLAIALVLGISAIQKRVSVRNLLLYAVVAVLPIVVFAGMITYAGILPHYYTLNYTVNARLIGTFTPFKRLLEFLMVNWLLWGCYAIGLSLCVRTANRRWLALVSLVLLASVFVVRAPFKQYYMPALPLIAMVAGHALGVVLRRRVWAIMGLIVIGLIWPIQRLSRDLRRTNSDQIAKIQYVLSITDPDDYVYDGHIQFNLFRKDLDFFWFSTKPGAALPTYQAIVGHDYDIYLLIDRHKPKIISNHQIDAMSHPAIAGRYEPSPLYEDLYVRKRDPTADELNSER